MKKKVLWAAITLCLSVLTIYALFYNSGLSIPLLVQDIKEASPAWLVPAFLCAPAFIFFEGRSLVLILRTLGYPAKKRRGFLYASADIYFSSITPSASGGQPASAYFMRKDGISGITTTVSLILNLTMYTLSIIFLGILSIIFFPEVFLSYDISCKVMILIGIAIMILLTVFFILLLKNQEMIFKIGKFIISIIKKFRFNAAAERTRERLDSMVQRYNECVVTVAGKKTLLLRTFLLNLAQRTVQILVTVFCHLALRGSSGNVLLVFAVQVYVVMGSNFIPVPGAVGLSEYLMYFGHSHLLGEEGSYSLAILSRGISFYATCIISLFTVMAGYLLIRLNKNKGAES